MSCIGRMLRAISSVIACDMAPRPLLPPMIRSVGASGKRPRRVRALAGGTRVMNDSSIRMPVTRILFSAMLRLTSCSLICS